MINTWFTSDTHFGHKNILEYEKEARPFSCLEEMHEVMIERWNSVVKPNDIIYHLGDFAFGKHWVAIAERLTGKKRLIMGNHDTYQTKLYLDHFEKLYGCLFWQRCVLSHMPVHPNGLGSRWMMNVHGHLHSNNVGEMKYSRWTLRDGIYHPEFKATGFEKDPNYFNVSTEQNNLTPIHEDIILQKVEELE